MYADARAVGQFTMRLDSMNDRFRVDRSLCEPRRIFTNTPKARFEMMRLFAITTVRLRISVFEFVTFDIENEQIEDAAMGIAVAAQIVACCTRFEIR